MTESNLMKSIMAAISKPGTRIFRNNCGAYKDATGRLIRYGVANPGGSDLIGWRSITITPDMVGKPVAVFTAVEVKGPKTRISPEQQNFIDRVRSAGGLAGIARSVEDAKQITHN